MGARIDNNAPTTYNALMNNWIKLTSATQISEFISAAHSLHSSLVSQMGAGDRPFFFDYWLKRFNHCDAWLLSEQSQAIALLTKPKVPGLHHERWQYSSLAIDERVGLPIELPVEMTKAQAFKTPAADYKKFFPDGFQTSYFQKGYGRSTEQLPVTSPPEGVTCKPLGEMELTDTLRLFDSGYHWEGQPEEYIPQVKAELVRSVKYGAGWCYIATKNSQPIAVAIYLALSAPLMGVPCAIVGDLLVTPEERRKGVASSLQNFAYHDLKRLGVRWIVGNIDPENHASIRQATAVGRAPIYHTLIVRP